MDPNTDLAHTAKNLMVAFRSSPYGTFNHAHANHNAFNILFAGKPLLYSTGYYIAYGDDHFKGWYIHSRGHNTVLIDGKGQEFSPEGYGWIARYLHGERISYCLGDASRAYGGAGLKRFRRHVALLRPSTIVVYDELEAGRPAQWTWLLHSHEKMAADAAAQQLTADTAAAHARVDLMGSVPLEITIDDQFDPPADNWRGVKDKDGSVKQYANQWHAKADATRKLQRMRYLAVIDVSPASGQAQPAAVSTGDDGWLTLGQWRIRAELDTAKPATLEVRHSDGKTVLAADVPESTVQGQTSPVGVATILVEVRGGKIEKQRSVDEAP